FSPSPPPDTVRRGRTRRPALSRCFCSLMGGIGSALRDPGRALTGPPPGPGLSQNGRQPKARFLPRRRAAATAPPRRGRGVSADPSPPRTPRRGTRAPGAAGGPRGWGGGGSGRLSRQELPPATPLLPPVRHRRHPLQVGQDDRVATTLGPRQEQHGLLD